MVPWRLQLERSILKESLSANNGRTLSGSNTANWWITHLGKGRLYSRSPHFLYSTLLNIFFFFAISIPKSVSDALEAAFQCSQQVK